MSVLATLKEAAFDKLVVPLITMALGAIGSSFYWGFSHITNMESELEGRGVWMRHQADTTEKLVALSEAQNLRIRQLEIDMAGIKMAISK